MSLNEEESKKLVTETVTRAKEEGLVLADEERRALWRFAIGSLPVDAYLGEEEIADHEAERYRMGEDFS
jgi:hypothetical protein